MFSAFKRSLSACVMLLLFTLSQGWANCGCASCPLDTRSSLDTDKGLVRLGYEFEFIDQDQPRIATRKAAVGEQPDDHDEQRMIGRTHRFIGSWNTTDRLNLELSLPYVFRTHRHIHNDDMGMSMPMGCGYSGVGDLSVQARYALYKPGEPAQPTLSGILGAKFPTGKTHVVNHEGDEAEVTMTPGTGSYDVTIGMATLQRLSVPTIAGASALMPAFTSLTYKINGKGTEDYRFGNQLFVNAGVTYPILGRVGLISQLNLLVRAKDSAGDTGEDINRTGGEFLYFSPGLHVMPGEDWEIQTIVQIPVRQRVNGIQLTSSWNLLSSIAYKFHL